MLLIEYERANDAVAAGSGRGVAAVAARMVLEWYSREQT